ncbi:MAG: RNA 2',3'-cyclic phosphodiesterase [Christensenellales bacterium]|jgi:2'-5' RNA ligase
MRLFVGIALNDEARDALRIATERMRKEVSGRYVPPRLYHITLAFLGELDAGRLDDVRAAMDDAALGFLTTAVALSKLGYFGKIENAILYCGVSGAQVLDRMAGALKRALTAHELTYDEKPFRAHITLARRVFATEALLDTPVDPVSFHVDGFMLFHSCRVDGELRYLPIHTSAFPR